MSKKMTHKEARSRLFDLSRTRMIVWFELSSLCARLAHDDDDDCIIAIISTFDKYRDVTREYDRRFKVLTS